MNKNNHSKKDIRVLKQLEKDTGHGFQTFGDLKEMDDFFTTDPDEVMSSRVEPPLFNKQPNKSDMARSTGKRK